MKVFVVDSPLRKCLGALPDSIELVAEPEADVELLLLDQELRPRLPELLARMPKLRVIQSTQAGVELVLPQVPKGIIVCSATGAHDIAVSEWVVMALLAVQHRLPTFLERQAHAVWDREVDGPICDLDGATVLIVGYGSIGRAVEARLVPFGATITRVAAHRREGVETIDALPRLLPEADVVVLLLPLTDVTRGLVDARFLARMRDGAIFVNAGRGAVVDTDALLAELSTGRLHAALDVTEPEPLPSEHPLWRAPNLVLTPHVAGSTARWRERVYKLAGDQIRRFAAGEPLLNIRSGG